MAKKKAVKKAIKKAPAKKAATKSRAANKVATVKKKPLTAAQKLAKVRREIAARNKRFQAADAAGKRVLIAQDVIAQIKLKRLWPTSGTWVSALDYRDNVDKVVGERDASIAAFEARSVREDFLAGLVGRCDCCALGAMFMGCALNNNKTTAKDLDAVEYDLGDYVTVRKTTGPLANGLNKFFSRQQLKLIEMAFEGGNGAFSIDLYYAAEAQKSLSTPRQPTDVEARLLAWATKYPDDDKRLIAIMKNIVANNGTFVP
jgi:hypothetical protein